MSGAFWKPRMWLVGPPKPPPMLIWMSGPTGVRTLGISKLLSVDGGMTDAGHRRLLCLKEAARKIWVAQTLRRLVRSITPAHPPRCDHQQPARCAGDREGAHRETPAHRIVRCQRGRCSMP